MKHLNKPPKPEEVESVAEEKIHEVNIKHKENVKLQHWIGNYRADFYYPDYNIVLEVDGRKWHSQDAEFTKDRVRDTYMTELGYTIVRASGSMAMKNPMAVVQSLKYIPKLKNMRSVYFLNEQSDMAAIQMDYLYQEHLI